jgi:hypothetical protein
MSARRFTQWQLYEIVEPFGERAAYWRAGQLCAAIHNSQRAKRTDPVLKPEDCMPRTFSSEDDDVAPVDEFDQLKALHGCARRRPA